MGNIILTTDTLQHPSIVSADAVRCQEGEGDCYALGHLSSAPRCVNTMIKFSDATYVTAVAK